MADLPGFGLVIQIKNILLFPFLVAIATITINLFVCAYLTNSCLPS